MVKFTAEELRRIMDYKQNIRNKALLAHLGESTRTDSLVAAAGVIAQQVAGDVRLTTTTTETRSADELAERGIRINSTGITLYYGKEQEDFLERCKAARDVAKSTSLTSLTRRPVDWDDLFSPEVAAALRITDGDLV